MSDSPAGPGYKELRARIKNTLPHYSGDPKSFAGRPFAVGIHQEMAAAWGLTGKSVNILRGVLCELTADPHYQQAIAEGGMRMHMDGSDAGRPTDLEIGNALDRLAARALTKTVRQQPRAESPNVAGARPTTKAPEIRYRRRRHAVTP